MNLKDKLKSAVVGKGATETIDFIWDLFDVDNRGALRKDIVNMPIEIKNKKVKDDSYADNSAEDQD